MCRLFGFRSVAHLKVHHALKAAENALAKQSMKHPDGWGVGYYLDDQPHVSKRASAAFQDYEYAHISEVVSSPTVIAHIRKATVGELSERNSHPFRFKRWLGAHNGHVEAFSQVRPLLLDELPKPLITNIQGTTDSEHLFHLVLSELADFADLDDPDLPLELAMGAVERALYKVDAWVERSQPGLRSETNLLITNGQLMLALRRGSGLSYAMQRGEGVSAHGSPRFQKDALGPLPVDRQVNHILISSEPLCGESLWQEIPQASILGVDRHLSWRIEPIHQRQHRVRGAKPLPDWPEVMEGAAPEALAEPLLEPLPVAVTGSLHGEAVVIAGFTSSLGLATARRLAAEDARLVVHDADAARVQADAQSIRKLRADIYTASLPTDASPPTLPLAIARGVDAFGFFSAALCLVDAPCNDPAQLAQAVATHEGFLCALYPSLCQRAPESVAPARVILAVVDTSRDAAQCTSQGGAQPSALAALRAALQRLLDDAASPLIACGVRVNALICCAATPPEDAAEVLLFLASPCSRALQGEVLRAHPPAAPARASSK
jgi:predicted glutamine amidotransferase/NAD(P)-dependent dehydrogenase (short-subunit alcohol dehydrogenase family)